MAGELTVVELEKRMRPGALSRMGFLGPDESLQAVVQRDAQALASLAISYEQLAAALQRVLGVAFEQRNSIKGSELRQRETPYPDLYHPSRNPHFSLRELPDVELGFMVDGHLQVFITQYRGPQECPWGCPFDPWGSFDFLLLNRNTGEYVTGPGLIVHLIREHRFFEGLESPYRLDPERAARVLELV